ncbi:MAG: hypothetical protein RIC36_03375 [Rhodospirillales bacterium]
MSEAGGKVDMEVQQRTWIAFNKFMVKVGVVSVILTVAIPYFVVF